MTYDCERQIGTNLRVHQCTLNTCHAYPLLTLFPDSERKKSVGISHQPTRAVYSTNDLFKTLRTFHV